MKNKGPRMYRKIKSTRERAIFSIPLVHLLINAKSWGQAIDVDDYKFITSQNDRQYGVIRWLVDHVGRKACTSLNTVPTSFYQYIYVKEIVRDLPF
jgi:hypothetical protein